jgi:trigger factor
MQVNITNLSDTKTKLTINADAKDIEHIKAHVLVKLAPKVKVAGFREGKVPAELVEKNLDPNYLQSEVIDDAVNHLYSDAVNQQRLRVVAPPKVELTKFVPYTELEFTAEVETVGTVTLPDYKKITVKKSPVSVTAKDVDEVLKRLQLQGAEYSEVDRPAKLTDRAWIDFEGTDAKGEKVPGADGKDYPLALGSNTFIPGFEDEIVGLKKGQDKTFTITFPKDYGVKALQAKKVTFKITVNKIEETTLEPIDDEFAKKTGPFKDLNELKADVKKQITAERETQAEREFENTIIKDLVKKSKINLPEALLQEQMDAVDREFRQNLTYRGETFQEYLKNTEQTEDTYRENELKPAATERLKAGLLLSEIAEVEGLNVTPEELEIRLQILKGQYASDPSMQAELDKPEARNDVASRLLTEKTIAKLVSYAK